MSERIDLDDYRWLVGEQAAAWLREAAAWTGGALALATRLRKDLSPSRASLVHEQALLRQKAREKFSAAERMFFTPLGLQQATDEIVARYKASRFPAQSRVADLCCGIGGDLLGLARRGPVVGIDRDEVTALLAEANCRACGLPLSGVTVLACDALHTSFTGCHALHLDPDRRPDGRRTTHVECHQPSLDQIEQLRSRHANMAIKLAPGTDPPEVWRGEAEWEWISREGQCRQLVAWFGSLTDIPGRRRATVLGHAPVPLRTICGDATREPPPCANVGRYVYEADAAVLAAGLNGQLAAEHDLAAIAAGIAYLTGDQLVADAALAAFAVEEQIPLDVKSLRGVLRQRGIGRLEIKKRGVPIDPQHLRGQLALRGESEATLILLRRDGRAIALLCRRVAAKA